MESHALIVNMDDQLDGLFLSRNLKLLLIISCI